MDKLILWGNNLFIPVANFNKTPFASTKYYRATISGEILSGVQMTLDEVNVLTQGGGIKLDSFVDVAEHWGK